MSVIKRKYIEITENSQDNNNCLEVTFYYDLGGYNCFTHKEESRGYYLSVTPLERKVEDGLVTECYTAFSGVRELIHPCNRKSTKAENVAREKLQAYGKMMIDYIVNKCGYKIEV